MDTNQHQILPKQQNRTFIKGLVIVGITLLLLIPAFFVQNLVEERASHYEEAVTGITSAWGGSQSVTGPVLMIPFHDTLGREHKFYLLPDSLLVNGIISPQERSRGLYKVMLYSSTINLSGRFLVPAIPELHQRGIIVDWSKAKLLVDLSDIKGLTSDVSLDWNNTKIPMSVSNDSPLLPGAMAAPVALDPQEPLQSFSFHLLLGVNGSGSLTVVPAGRQTSMELHSTAAQPSFTGPQLPVSSSFEKNGFSATWKTLAHSRKFPQQWLDNSFSMNESAIGVSFYVPLNGYQKTLRSVKYAILCILLTFAASFLVETVGRRFLSLINYVLIGFALIVFYLLLLSISEFTGFNLAYGIATLATSALVTWFLRGVLGSSRLSAILCFVLITAYSYVFVTLQLQEYALLMGSLGLFISLSLIMYFSRKMKWGE